MSEKDNKPMHECLRQKAFNNYARFLRRSSEKSGQDMKELLEKDVLSHPLTVEVGTTLFEHPKETESPIMSAAGVFPQSTERETHPDIYHFHTPYGTLSYFTERNLAVTPLLEEDNTVQLTRVEGIILEQLIQNPLRAYRSQDLADVINEMDGLYMRPPNIKTHISHLRRKLGDNKTDKKFKIIHPSHGIGYSLTQNKDIAINDKPHIGLTPIPQSETEILELLENENIKKYEVTTAYGSLFYIPERKLAYSPLPNSAKPHASLTRIEGILLELLMTHPKQVITNYQLAEAILKDFAEEPNQDILKTHITHIRKKLGDSRIVGSMRFELINSVAGTGYYLDGKRVRQPQQNGVVYEEQNSTVTPSSL